MIISGEGEHESEVPGISATVPRPESMARFFKRFFCILISITDQDMEGLVCI